MTAANILALLAIAITALVSLSALGWFVYKRGSANGKSELDQETIGAQLKQLIAQVADIHSQMNQYIAEHGVQANKIRGLEKRTALLEKQVREDHDRIRTLEAKLDIPSPSRTTPVVPDDETTDLDPV